MNAARLLILTIILVGCGASVADSASPVPTSPESQSAATMAPDNPSPAASQPEAGGVFVFTPGVMDCPGEPGGLCPSYTIAEAITAPGQPGSPLIVRGHVLIEPDGTGWYCETLTDSAPPQCAGERLEFDGLDLVDPAMFEELDGVQWSEQVQLLGEMRP